MSTACICTSYHKNELDIFQNRALVPIRDRYRSQRRWNPGDPLINELRRLKHHCLTLRHLYSSPPTRS